MKVMTLVIHIFPANSLFVTIDTNLEPKIPLNMFFVKLAQVAWGFSRVG